ncbi:hypothetical protein CN593_05540 [Bacillus pseudomycoides]|nr:hypothetical protein CN593_05540 [Bacillus pseudomycoides]
MVLVKGKLRVWHAKPQKRCFWLGRRFLRPLQIYISDFFKITYIFVVASLDKLFNKFKYQEEIKYG